MRFFPAIILILLLASSITITNFSAFAQTTLRPYYTVLETPTHTPETLYEKTPAEFTTKVTNQGTAAKQRDVFVKMSHSNDAGEHNYTCDATSGAYSQSVNLTPGESIDLHWNCEIFNPGTYTLTILDKTFTYTVVAGENKIRGTEITTQQNPPKSQKSDQPTTQQTKTPTQTSNDKKLNQVKTIATSKTATKKSTDERTNQVNFIKKAYLLILWDQVISDKILKLDDFQIQELKKADLMLAKSKTNDKKTSELKQKIATASEATKKQAETMSAIFQNTQNQVMFFKDVAGKVGISKSYLDKVAKTPLSKLKESKKINNMEDFKKAKNDLTKAKDQEKKAGNDLMNNVMIPTPSGKSESLKQIQQDASKDDKPITYDLDLIEWDDRAVGEKTSLGESRITITLEQHLPDLREHGDSTGIFQSVIEIPKMLRVSSIGNGEEISLDYVDWGPPSDSILEDMEDIKNTQKNYAASKSVKDKN